MAWYRGKSGGGTVTPTDGIYANKVLSYKGYYNNGFCIVGWSTSTELIFKISASAGIFLQDVTSCSLDGTPLTVSSYQAFFPNGIDYTVDHVLEFTVREGYEPSIYGSNNAQRTITKCIFNK